MVFTCVVCTIKEPPLVPLRTEHRQLLEVIVSPVLDTTELKGDQWLHCMDCMVLLKSVHSFQQTALKGMRAFKCLLNKYDGVMVTGQSGGVTGVKPMLEAKPEILLIKTENSKDPETDRQLISVTQSKEINPLSEDVHVKSEPGTAPKPDSHWDSQSQKILKQTVPCNVPHASSLNNHIRVFTIKKPTPRTQTNAVIKINPQTLQKVQAVKVVSGKAAMLANVQSTYNPLSAKTAQSVKVLSAKQAPLANVQSTNNPLSAKTAQSVKVMSAKQAPLANVQTANTPLSAETVQLANVQSANNLLSAKTAQSVKVLSAKQAPLANVQSANPLLSAKTVQSANALPSPKAVQLANVLSTNNLLPANVQSATTVQSAKVDPANTTQSVKVPKTKEEVAANAAKVVVPEDRLQEYMPWEERKRKKYIPKRASCPHCNLSLSSKAALSAHVTRKHSDPSPVDCKTCGKTFPSGRTLNMHMAKHKQESLTLEDFDPELYCKECDKSFSLPSGYRAHLLSLKHTPREQYAFECETCKKRFPSERRRQEHNEVVHLRQKRHKCDVCGKSYGKQFALRVHTLRAHERPRRPRARPHVCHRCGKAFTVEKTLREHLLAHEGLRPFRCPLCPATFSYAAALYTHNRLKHLRWKRKEKGAAEGEEQLKEAESGRGKDTESEKVVKESEKVRKVSKKVRKVTNKVRKQSKKVKKESNKAERESEKVEKESEKLERESEKMEKVMDVGEKESEQVEKELKQMENELKLLEPADSMDIDLFFNEMC